MIGPDLKNFAIPSAAERRLVKNVIKNRDPDGSTIPRVETTTATWIKTCGMASVMGSENQIMLVNHLSQILSSVLNSQKIQIFVLESKYTKNAKITIYFDQKRTQIKNKPGPPIMQIHLVLDSTKYSATFKRNPKIFT